MCFGPLPFVLKTLSGYTVHDSRLVALNVSSELLSSHEIGRSIESFRQSLSSSLNHRMRTFLDEQFYGHSFLDTGFQFVWGKSFSMFLAN